MPSLASIGIVEFGSTSDRFAISTRTRDQEQPLCEPIPSDMHVSEAATDAGSTLLLPCCKASDRACRALPNLCGVRLVVLSVAWPDVVSSMLLKHVQTNYKVLRLL